MTILQKIIICNIIVAFANVIGMILYPVDGLYRIKWIDHNMGRFILMYDAVIWITCFTLLSMGGL